VQRIQSGRKRDNNIPYGQRQSRGGCKGYRAGGKLIKRRAENLMSKSRSHETSVGEKNALKLDQRRSRDNRYVFD
jgi:hypothetical protein